LFPDSSQAFTLYLDGTDLYELDVSSLSGLSGFTAYGNTHLTTVRLASKHYTSMSFVNDAVTASNIESILTQLYNYWNVTLPTSNSTIDFQGGTNGKITGGYANVTLNKIVTIFDSSTIYDVSIRINV
jgi:hypothetical protein